MSGQILIRPRYCPDIRTYKASHTEQKKTGKKGRSEKKKEKENQIRKHTHIYTYTDTKN
jgi:hypothetical protein